MFEILHMYSCPPRMCMESSAEANKSVLRAVQYSCNGVHEEELIRFDLILHILVLESDKTVYVGRDLLRYNAWFKTGQTIKLNEDV